MSDAPLLARVPPDPNGLRRAKRTATGLLAGAAGLFVVSAALPDSTGVGFLRAAAEAGTIGGLADWFAVTALFRHPLGIPVPHTALVPRQKDELATRLGEFVTGNFLTADAVAGQLREGRVVHRLADALAEPGAAQGVSRELAAAATAALDALDVDRVTAYALDLVRRDLDRRSYAPLLGSLLGRALDGGAHRPLVEVLVRRARTHLEEQGEQLVPHVQRLLDGMHLLTVLVDTTKVSRRLVDTAAQILREAEADPAHGLRTGLDDLLERTAADLRFSPRTARDLDARLAALAADPQVHDLLHGLLTDLRATVRSSLTEGSGDLAGRLGDLAQEAARRVAGDPALERRLEERLLAGVRVLVEQHGDTVVRLVQRTVAGWEARDASARIEASVGRDLQFIRINGTVVGALAGVVLHAVDLPVT